MKYFCKRILIWIGDYFPAVPRFFGLKILSIGYIDITPDIGCGSRPNGKIVESKVSWLVKSEWSSPLPIRISMDCVQAEDTWAQVYSVNLALHGGWNRDVSCGAEKFDSELRKKHKNTIVPPRGLLKIDHFASRHPHPSCESDQAFQIVPDDPSVIVRHRSFLNQKGVKAWQWCMRFLIGGIGLTIVGCLAMYFWVQFGVPVWQFFFR